MIHKGWGQTSLLRSVILHFQTDALGINATKSLFSSDLTKEAKIENPNCCNLSLGLATKARACKGAGQEGSPGVTFHAPRSLGE